MLLSPTVFRKESKCWACNTSPASPTVNSGKKRFHTQENFNWKTTLICFLREIMPFNDQAELSYTLSISSILIIGYNTKYLVFFQFTLFLLFCSNNISNSNSILELCLKSKGFLTGPQTKCTLPSSFRWGDELDIFRKKITGFKWL